MTTTITIREGDRDKVPRFTYLRALTPADKSVFNEEVCEGHYLLLTTGEVDSDGDLVFCAIPAKSHTVTGNSPLPRQSITTRGLAPMEGVHGQYVQFLHDQVTQERFEVVTDPDTLSQFI